MATRNLSRLVFETLRNRLVEVTGVASGLIVAKYPDPTFFGFKDGPNPGPINPVRLPAIGMTFYKNPMINRNRISGYEKIFDVGSGMVAEFSPKGEQHFNIELHIFALSRTQVENIANDIILWLIDDDNFALDNDPLSDYCSIKPGYTKDYHWEHNPYHFSVLIDLCGTIYKEATGTMVNNIFVNIATSINGLPVSKSESVLINYDVDGFVEQEDVTVPSTNLMNGFYNLTEFVPPGHDIPLIDTESGSFDNTEIV